MGYVFLFWVILIFPFHFSYADRGLHEEIRFWKGTDQLSAIEQNPDVEVFASLIEKMNADPEFLNSLEVVVAPNSDTDQETRFHGARVQILKRFYDLGAKIYTKNPERWETDAAVFLKKAETFDPGTLDSLWRGVIPYLFTNAGAEAALIIAKNYLELGYAIKARAILEDLIALKTSNVDAVQRIFEQIKIEDSQLNTEIKHVFHKDQLCVKDPRVRENWCVSPPPKLESEASYFIFMEPAFVGDRVFVIVAQGAVPHYKDTHRYIFFALDLHSGKVLHSIYLHTIPYSGIPFNQMIERRPKLIVGSNQILFSNLEIFSTFDLLGRPLQVGDYQLKNIKLSANQRKLVLEDLHRQVSESTQRDVVFGLTWAQIIELDPPEILRFFSKETDLHGKGMPELFYELSKIKDRIYPLLENAFLNHNSKVSDRALVRIAYGIDASPSREFLRRLLSHSSLGSWIKDYEVKHFVVKLVARGMRDNLVPLDAFSILLSNSIDMTSGTYEDFYSWMNHRSQEEQESLWGELLLHFREQGRFLRAEPIWFIRGFKKISNEKKKQLLSFLLNTGTFPIGRKLDVVSSLAAISYFEEDFVKYITDDLIPSFKIEGVTHTVFSNLSNVIMNPGFASARPRFLAALHSILLHANEEWIRAEIVSKMASLDSSAAAELFASEQSFSPVNVISAKKIQIIWANIFFLFKKLDSISFKKLVLDTLSATSQSIYAISIRVDLQGTSPEERERLTAAFGAILTDPAVPYAAFERLLNIVNESPFDTRQSHLEFVKVVQKTGDWSKIDEILRKLKMSSVLSTQDFSQEFKEKIVGGLLRNSPIDSLYAILDFCLKFPDPAYLPTLQKFSKLGHRYSFDRLINVLQKISYGEAVNSVFEPKLWESVPMGRSLESGLTLLMSDSRFYELPSSTIEAVLKKFFSNAIGDWSSDTSKFLGLATVEHREVLLNLWIKIFKHQDDGDLMGFVKMLKTIRPHLSQKEDLDSIADFSPLNLSLNKRLAILEYMGTRDVLKSILKINVSNKKRFEEEFLVPAFKTAIEKNKLGYPRTNLQAYFTLRSLAKASRSNQAIELIEALAASLSGSGDSDLELVLDTLYELDSRRAEDYVSKELSANERLGSKSTCLKILARSTRGIKILAESSMTFENTQYASITQLKVLEELFADIDSENEEKRLAAKQALERLLPLCAPGVYGVVQAKIKD